MSMSIGSNMPPPPPPNQSSSQQVMTDEQKNSLSSILEEYDAGNLSEDDAKSIVEQFQEAGIKPGKEMASLMKEAGFDAHEVGTLAGVGPPSGNEPPASQSSPAASASGVNEEALQMLQEILNAYEDLPNLTSKQKETLQEELESSGLLDPGALINTYS